METLKLFKENLHADYNTLSNLRQLVVELEKNLQAKGQVICKVIVNGMRLSEGDEIRLAETKLSEIDLIEVEHESLKDLVVDTVEELKSHLTILADQAMYVSESFRQNHSIETERKFADFLISLQSLTDALIALKPNIISLGDDQSLNDRWESFESHMEASMRELMVSYEKQDFVLVADVLEYEITTCAHNWLLLLERLS